jgi:hypothetical protein
MPLDPANTFSGIVIDDLIRESFERCGLDSETITASQLRSARFSLNFLLVDYINRGLNLFTVRQNVIDISPGQQTYLLNGDVVDILEMTAGSLSRITEAGSTPFSSAGVAENAFDDDWSTSCDTGSPQGEIGIEYPTGQSVAYVGIVNANSLNSTFLNAFNIMSSNDDVNWIDNAYIPPIQMIPGQRYWFPLDVTATSKYWKIVGASNNEQDVNIAELYFSVPLLASSTTYGQPSRYLVREKRDVWMQQPVQNLVAPPAYYYLDRNIDNVLRLWPIPDTTYQQLIFTTKNYINSANSFTQTLPVPLRFFNALAAGLSNELSTKYAVERKDLLERQAEIAFSRASEEDFERAPISFGFDFQGV